MTDPEVLLAIDKKVTHIYQETELMNNFYREKLKDMPELSVTDNIFAAFMLQLLAIQSLQLILTLETVKLLNNIP